MRLRKNIVVGQGSRPSLALVPRPPRRDWMRRLRLQPEDLIAIPLCLLWCAGFVLLSGAVGNSLSRHLAGTAALASGDPAGVWKGVLLLVTITWTVVRQWFA
jgi:hypothetical protein